MEPQSRQERLFLLLSIFIGVISGLLVVSFRMAIEWLNVLLLGSSIQPHQSNLIFVPALAGVVIAILTRFVFPQVTGSGINQTKTAMYIHNGYISFRTVIGKFLLSALAIGSGYSLGPEDPSLQIGAGVASLVSRRFGLSNARLRLFAPIGAAAGLAAAFNAPISAILFVIEEIIGQWSADVLGSIVLSAISSVVVARWFWGAEPMFSVPAVTLRDPRELAAYAVMGVLGGGAAFVFARSLEYLRPRAQKMRRGLRLAQPAVAGLLVGCIGYFGLPQVMGAGYGAIDQAMHAQFAWKMLLLLALFKLIATTLSFSSGTPGGMFAPTLFVGAMLGAGVGSLEKLFLPHLTGSVASYAVVGMGVLFAAFLRAPLTSVFMAMEISGNYSIVVPVILANTIAYLISRSLQPTPIFEFLTHQDGLWLPSMEEQREERDLHLEDALQKISAPVLEGSSTVQDALKFLRQDCSHVIVRCAKGLWYVAGKREMDAIRTAAAADESFRAARLEDKIGAARTPMLFPDLALSSALPYFHRWPLLPVMNRAARGALEGTITLEDVLRRYQQE
ncbi:MAG TPA: chloride channel protein [Bryobacteraceae bacterium]